MSSRIFLEIDLSQGEQSSGRSQSRALARMFLQMNESAGELNQAFIKSVIGPLPLFEPKFLKDIMRFIKKAAVKALEVAQVVRIMPFAMTAFDQCGDFRILFAHDEKIRQI